MPEISVIVPVYKVEKYLSQCIDSILSQTFADFELILVDDGSPDSCGKICDEYAKRDCRIKVIHQANKGLAGTRNSALQTIRGKYVAFVDSDDYIEKDMLECLYNGLVENDADMSAIGNYDCYVNQITPRTRESIQGVFSPPEAMELMLLKIGVGTVCKLYKKSIFSDIRYPEGEDVAEDLSVIIEILLKTTKVYIDTTPKYYYVHRKGSLLTSHFSEKKFSIIKANEKNYSLLAEHYPQLLGAAKYRLVGAYRYLLDKVLDSDKASRKRYLKDIRTKAIHITRQNILEMIKLPYISPMNKAGYCMLAICPRVYILASKLRSKKREKMLIDG